MPPQNPQQPGGFDMNAMLQAFAQAQLQQQQAYFNNQHRRLGMSGEDVTGQKGPYDSGGIDWLKNNRMDAGQLQARQAQMPWADERQPQNPATFGTPTHQNPFVMPQAPQMNAPGDVFGQQMQQNAALYAPGGFQQPQPQAFVPPQPQQPQPFAPPQQKKKKPGISFGASASPRPGSSFGF